MVVYFRCAICTFYLQIKTTFSLYLSRTAHLAEFAQLDESLVASPIELYLSMPSICPRQSQAKCCVQLKSIVNRANFYSIHFIQSAGSFYLICCPSDTWKVTPSHAIRSGYLVACHRISTTMTHHKEQSALSIEQFLALDDQIVDNKLTISKCNSFLRQ